MQYTCIPYTRVPRSSALLTDYLYHFERVAPFYNGSPFDLASYKAVARDLQGFHKHRREVSEILARQSQTFGCGELTLANIRRLREPGTFAVVTGQQVGLVSGPAFTLYKALTAIRLAQWLSEQGLPAVPVFWLATEDHDLQEVAEASTLDEDYNLVPLRDAGERPAHRSSVGYVKLSAAIEPALDRLESVLAPGEPRDLLIRDLRESYRPGVSWGQAFGRFMARLFNRWGVILVDALDQDIHRLVAGVYAQAIDHAQGLRKRLQDRSQALVRAGYHAQVHVGEDSTLLFVARDGNRLPIHQPEEQGQPGGRFSLDDTEKITWRELKAWVENQPLDFSSNALLRPVVQDTLLPTLAYVAGPAELAYLGQSQAVYSEFGRPMPVIFTRAGFTLMDRRTERAMEKHSLKLEDVWKGEDHLGRKIAAAGFPGSKGWLERFDQSEQELATLLERLRQDIQAIDPTLLDSLKHAEEKIKYQLERLKGKLSRAALERSELLQRHEQMLLRFLMPRRDLQEREVSGVYFLGRAGYELLERLLNQIQVHSSDHQVIAY